MHWECHTTLHPYLCHHFPSPTSQHCRKSNYPTIKYYCRHFYWLFEYYILDGCIRVFKNTVVAFTYCSLMSYSSLKLVSQTCTTCMATALKFKANKLQGACVRACMRASCKEKNIVIARQVGGLTATGQDAAVPLLHRPAEWFSTAATLWPEATFPRLHQTTS